MCERVVGGYPWAFKLVPDWFVMQEMCENMKTREDFALNANEFITWYEAYKKGKSQKAQIKEDLMPIYAKRSYKDFPLLIFLSA